VLICLPYAARAQTTTLTGRVEFEGARKTLTRHLPQSVVWLTPLSDPNLAAIRNVSSTEAPLRMVQRNKSFEPHLLVVPVGAAVEFPNHDPFFHNVFSLFEGRRFDLGLYEAGSTQTVHFDRPGISYIFCNIHPEMSSVIIALDNRLYAVSDSAGHVSIADVPPGRYILHVWNERAAPDSLDAAAHEITINPDSTSLGTLRLTLNSNLAVAHKNKYGREYDQPSPSNPVYPQP
jgi:plastocyanin